MPLDTKIPSDCRAAAPAPVVRLIPDGLPIIFPQAIPVVRIAPPAVVADLIELAQPARSPV